MSLKKSPGRHRRSTLIAALVVASELVLMPSVLSAEGSQCHTRDISKNINDAVLALKATQYCVGQELPYTQIAVFKRIEALRCGPETSAQIDKLMDKFDKNYRMIMTSDPSMTVCKQAALLSID